MAKRKFQTTIKNRGGGVWNCQRSAVNIKLFMSPRHKGRTYSCREGLLLKLNKSILSKKGRSCYRGPSPSKNEETTVGLVDLIPTEDGSNVWLRSSYSGQSASISCTSCLESLNICGRVLRALRYRLFNITIKKKNPSIGGWASTLVTTIIIMCRVKHCRRP